MTPHTHNGLSNCTLCGLAFPHYHPDKTKPKEFVSLEDGVMTSEDMTLEKLDQQRDEMWREKLEGLKKDHIRDGVNMRHEEDEYYCCGECLKDDFQNEALEEAKNIKL